MPINHSADLLQNGVETKSPSKLVLCFDGTGNQYSGDTSDTNIVKLYQKFDRKTKNQFHYYQPGIGTYSAGIESVNAGPWGRFKRSVSQIIDEGIGTTFDSHVIAGYRFVMRYYDDGDKIYLFGFSRGAFTARFLARMITTIGVLSKGNEEMVPFAYKSYQDYESGSGKFKTAKEHQDWMSSFKVTFCRLDVKVHFLGLFDTVNSVGTFDVPFARKTYLPTVLGTAHHIRHAVAIDERRCKFKVALLQHDKEGDHDKHENIEEVYFPGNHGDVGGGWLAEGKKDVDEADDPVQLSDIALEWMITELQKLPVEHPEEKIAFNEHVEIFLRNIRGKMAEACTARIHDVLKFGGGEGWMMVLFWNFLEYLPFFKRLELVRGRWVSQTFPPNMGDTRDIPIGAALHPCVKARMSKTLYRPKNQGLEDLK